MNNITQQLPEYIKKRIEKETNDWYHTLKDEDKIFVTPAYRAGALAEAIRAMELVKALILAECELKSCYRKIGIPESSILKDIQTALDNYNKQ